MISPGGALARVHRPAGPAGTVTAPPRGPQGRGPRALLRGVGTAGKTA